MQTGLFHFVYGASPQHILLHFPIKLLHLPIKFASFPQQIASFPQQFASFPQQIASFSQHSFSLPQHIVCHFAKHRIKVFSTIPLFFYRFWLSPDSFNMIKRSPTAASSVATQPSKLISSQCAVLVRGAPD